MKHYTITQTAAALGVTRQSVHSRVKRGLIKAERTGHRWLVPDSEIARLQTSDEVARRAKYMGSAR